MTSNLDEDSNTSAQKRDREWREKEVISLKGEGYSNRKIGELLGINESTVRRMLNKTHDVDSIPTSPRSSSEKSTFRISYRSYVDIPADTAIGALAVFMNPNHDDDYKGGPVTIEKL